MLTKIRDTGPKTILLAAAVLFSVFPLLSMLSAALAPQGTVPNGISIPNCCAWSCVANDAWWITLSNEARKAAILTTVSAVCGSSVL